MLSFTPAMQESERSSLAIMIIAVLERSIKCDEMNFPLRQHLMLIPATLSCSLNLSYHLDELNIPSD